MRTGREILALAAVAALCACGGSGGSGGGGGSGDGGLVVTPTSLTFTYVIGGASPPSQTVSANWTATDAYYFAAAYQNGVTPASWLSASTGTVSGRTGSISFTVSPLGTAGTRTTTISMGIARQDGSIIAYRDVTVTYVVTSFGTTPTAVSSSFVFGSSVAPATKTVSVSAPSPAAWTATADQSWIHLAAASGTTPSSVTLSFDPTGLAIGVHGGTVTFSAAGQTARVAVTLTVAKPTVTVNPATVALAGLGGHDLSPKTVQVSLDTGTNAYPWTATTAADWMDLAQLATTVASTPTSFTIAPTAAAKTWPSGTTADANVTVTVNVNGVSVQKELSVSYAPDDLKLLVSDDGVALTSTPGLSRLSRSVAVFTNRRLPGSWTATSDQTWLEVTPAGTTDDALVLTADPTGLAADAVHEATVTVTSSDPGLAVTTATVRVGLWVGSVTPADPTSVAGSQVEVAADPVRPYAYVHDGGTALTVLNVHTGAVVSTVPALAAALGSLAVSGDGAQLFAVDKTARKVVPVDLATMTPGAPWDLPATATSGSRITYARTNGVPVVLTTEGSIHDPATGASLAAYATPPSYGTTVAASRDGSRVCRLVLGLSPSYQECHALDARSSSAASSIAVGPARTGSGGTNGKDVALSPDGTRSYVASGGVYDFIVVDATAFGHLPTLGYLPGDAYPVAVDVGFDGRVYCGAVTSLGDTSVWVYEAGGTLVGSYDVWNVRDRGLAATGDGLRLVVASSPSTTIVTVPP